MAITPPVMSLGLYAPNLSFSRPSETDNIPAAWTVDARITATAMYADGPTYGHIRWQRFELKSPNTYGTVVSAPCPPGRLSCAGVQDVYYALVVRTDNVSGSGQEVRLELVGYDENGGGAVAQIVKRIHTAYASWTLLTGETTLDFTAKHHRRYQFVFGRNVGDVRLDIAQVGIGLWSDGFASYTFPQHLAGRETDIALPSDEVNPYTTLTGEERWVDFVRASSPRSGVMAFDWLPEKDAQTLVWLWGMNHGYAQERGSGMLGGGRWPILLTPNLSGWPLAMMVRITDRRLNLVRAADWLEDSPHYNGSLSLLEVL